MDFLSPTYLVDNVSLNLVGMVPLIAKLLGGFVSAIPGLPAQSANSFALSPMLIDTLPGGLDYLAWISSAFLDIFGLMP